MADGFKMMLCVRTDLAMGTGKMCAQCGHAAVGCYQRAVERYPDIVAAWVATGCAKIAVRIAGEAEWSPRAD